MRRALDGLIAAVATCVLACGAPPSKSPDTYNGAIDPSALDPKFIQETSSTKICGSGTGASPCYVPQIAFAGGRQVFFYNLGVVPTATGGKPPTYAASQVTATVYDFPADSCTAVTTDPLRDPYPKDHQLSIFSALPLAANATATVPVTPLVQVSPVSGASETCNDLKTADSVQAGKFGATVGASTYAVRAPIDFVNVLPLFPGSTFAPQLGWYKGLLLYYLDGGAIPVDGNGNLVAMDAALVTYGSTPSTPTTTNAVVLPAAPGAPGYSPLVRLHSITAPAGASAGTATKPPTFTAICATPPTCAANEVNLGSVPVANTLFIAGSAQ